MTDTFDLSNPLKPTITKDPNSNLDYTFDWTLWLDDITDTIQSQNVTVDAGVTKSGAAVVTGNKKVVVFIAGGTVGGTYKVTCEIQTVGGRTDDRTIYIKIKDR